MAGYLEHVNISVTDIDEAVRFFSTAMPDFRVRHDSGPGADRWVHLGTEETYISIHRAPFRDEDELRQERPGLSHVGFVVDDADALYRRMRRAGYREGFVPPPHPYRKRVYFLDSDGIEYEFVEYLSSEPSKKNDYRL